MTLSRLSPAQWAIAYAVAFIVIALLDGIWLGVLAKDFYRRELGTLMTDSVRVIPAIGFYVLYPLAVVFLAVATRPDSIGEAALRCAVIGAAAYGTYDLTNLATLRGYTVSLALVDWAWGTFATTVAGTTAWWAVIGRA